ncbi:MAG: mannonate dehydratase [Bryobacteraceae bacterium]
MRAAASAAIPAALHGATVQWPPALGAGLPRICVIAGSTPTQMRHFKQMGIDYVIGGGPGPLPWTEEKLRAVMDPYKAGGLTVINLMIGGFEDVIRGGPKRDEQIEKVIQSIRAAGKAGLPVIEYNFYAHRLVEGYEEELGRGEAGMTAFKYAKVKDLPPLPNEGTHKREDLFKRAEYFLKAIVPEAEKANVRLALHPNDPPAPISRGSEQMMGTFENWKRYLNLVKSPYNGMTFDCGVTRELGEDPVTVCKWMGARDQINHVHFRNVVVRKPYEDYTEVFLDEGVVNMFAVMRELVRQKYPRGLYPEHPRAIDLDRNMPESIRGQYARVGGGGLVGEVFNIAYAKAMLQAVLSHR